MTPSSQRTPSSVAMDSPSPPLSSDPTTINLQLVLLNTRWYYETQYEKALSPPCDSSQKFWTDIKSAIYFQKIGSHACAQLLLQDAGAKVDGICQQLPFNIMRDIYTTLSPTNTKSCRQFRVGLLRLSAATSNQRWGPQHPLTIICHQLQMDDTAEVSTTSVHLMVNDFETSLTNHNIEVLQLKRTLISLLRRGRELMSAEMEALSLLRDTNHNFGIDSEWSGLAMSGQVHILTDQHRWSEASGWCRSVLTSAEGTSVARFQIFALCPRWKIWRRFAGNCGGGMKLQCCWRGLLMGRCG
jgi:hypothetical protein